jgi:hypothetical protein
VALDGPPKYGRPAVATSFAPSESAVRQLLMDTPDMPATVLAERVAWTGSITWFRDNVSNDYSVDPSVIGRFVDVTADLSRVEVRQHGRLVAAHDRSGPAA